MRGLVWQKVTAVHAFDRKRGVSEALIGGQFNVYLG